MKGLCATVVGVFRGFFKICSPAGQENFGFPAPSFCHLGVFLPIPDFCSLFVPSTQMRNMGKREQNRKFLPKTPNLLFHSPEFLQNSLSEGEQNSQNSSKTPKRIRRGKRPDGERQGILLYKKKETENRPLSQRTIPCLLAVILLRKCRSASSRRSPSPGKRCWKR